jgi:hypothetical protein
MDGLQMLRRDDLRFSSAKTNGLPSVNPEFDSMLSMRGST